MLRSLHIRNLAIIDELTLEFGAGFSVLSGETGAGKSILIDALGLVLGDRADPAMVRGGETQAEVTAEFVLDALPRPRAWLREQAMEDAGNPESCLIRRVVSAEGRTRAFINGVPTALSSLRELGEQLVEIHGQNEHQSLLRAEAQCVLLDEFGGYAESLTAVEQAARDYADAEAAIAHLKAVTGRDPAQLEYLRFQVQELDALNLQAGELEQLEADHKHLANAGRLLQEGGQAQELLYGGESSLYDQLTGVRNLIMGLTPLHAAFADAESLITNAQIQAQEAADTVRRILDRLDLDPERLDDVERRLAAIHDLARKHRIKPNELPVRLEALSMELRQSENAAGELEKLEAGRTAALKAYEAAAQKLSAARRKAAQDLAKQVTAIVRELGMPKAEFQVAVESAPQQRPRLRGDDEIRFDFSANPGQPPRPLSKVASGGELSRVSLAIQVVANQKSAAPTLIFDEVDAGIGGGTAEIVGGKLRKLAAGRQVLCVTHLPQVAAQGERHYAIEKEVRGETTVTRVRLLDSSKRVMELARMLGGREITASTQAHAKEMLQRAAGKAE